MTKRLFALRQTHEWIAVVDPTVTWSELYQTAREGWISQHPLPKLWLSLLKQQSTGRTASSLTSPPSARHPLSERFSKGRLLGVYQFETKRYRTESAITSR